uniref:Uncharacterized protein n=1 Tax=Anopheles albimanus TaxID=7167 RepID=A0A182FXG2_ANOAL
ESERYAIVLSEKCVRYNWASLIPAHLNVCLSDEICLLQVLLITLCERSHHVTLRPERLINGGWILFAERKSRTLSFGLSK